MMILLNNFLLLNGAYDFCIIMSAVIKILLTKSEHISFFP